MIKKILKAIFLCTLINLGTTWLLLGDDQPSICESESPSIRNETLIVKRIEVPKADLVVLNLENGMTVCLKKTCSEDEIIVRLTAPGGYSSFPNQQRASIQLAPQIAIHSGLGKYQFDRLHALLYEHGIEFNAEVQAFCRYVEGTAFIEDFGTLLELIQLFFTQRHFTDNAFRRVMQKEKEKISHRSKRTYQNFDDLFIEFNNPDSSTFQRLKKRHVDQANHQISREFLDKGFRDPSEFACVITGYFDMEAMVALVSKQLSAIPSPKAKKTKCELPVFPKLLSGIKTKVISNQPCFDGESTTVLTFPVPVKITNKNFTSLENLASLLYVRLKKALRKEYGNDSMVITVSVEYPFYPCLSSPLIKIQYITNKKLVTPMSQTILSNLRKMQKEGVTKEEIATMNRKYRKAQRFRESDNRHWIMILSNYIMWKWEVGSINDDLQPMGESSEITKNLQEFFSLDNYTILSAHP